VNLAGLAQGLVLAAAANATPLLAKRLLGAHLAWPLDGGHRFFDGRPLLGPSKTVRGVAVALLAATAAALLMGLPAGIGALAGAAAMAGDMLSSFTKRRLGRPSSSQMLLIDQVPESLLPLLAVAVPMRLGVAEIALGVLAFFVGELLLSRLLFRIGLRDEPY